MGLRVAAGIEGKTREVERSWEKAKETVKSRFSDRAYANGMYGIRNFTPPAQYSRAEYLQLSWPVARIQLAFSTKTNVAHDNNTFPNGAVWCATTNSISSPRFQPPIPHGISTTPINHRTPFLFLPSHLHLTSHSPHKKHSLLPPSHTHSLCVLSASSSSPSRPPSSLTMDTSTLPRS